MTVTHGAPATSLERDLREAGFRGDIAADAAARSAMSTDNSVYRIEPDAVVAPRDAEDVSCLLHVLALPEHRGVPVTARGGGTGTNGQSLNRGVIVDFRRHMTRILAVDAAAGWVDVEPGIVLADLNARLSGTGMFFAPDTSTATRCTIGGMVATDASGKGSRIFGKTSDNVLGLELALMGGGRIDSVEPTPDWAHATLDAVRSACLSGRASLLERVPDIARRFTGYDLARASPDAGRFEWWRLPIGAEGTLGLVTRLRLRLTPRPRERRLLVLAFETFDTVLRATPSLLTANPAAIEVIDGWVTQLSDDAGLLDLLPATLRAQDGGPPVCAFVELVGETTDAVSEHGDRIEAIARQRPGFRALHATSASAEIANLWAVRSAAVGLLAGSTTGRRPISFVEDCVVPPPRLAEYVAGFAAIMQKHSLQYGIYGHADVGCLHTRPALDMDAGEDRRIFAEVSDEVYALASRLGGIFWGEHGKGVRGAYLEDFVGAEAYAAFRAVKQAFDPDNRFNPGKLVAPSGELYPVDGTPLRTGIPATREMANAFSCNGNAACLSVVARTPMCPSFKISGDLRHSPKGRAEVLRAWDLAGGADAPQELTDAAVAALDGCLGCKSCAGQCPASVDIPELKSRFLATLHRSRGSPAGARAAVWMERAAPVLARVRPTLRIAARTGADRALARAVGLVDPPVVTPAARVPCLGPADLATGGHPDEVAILPDPFTTLFDGAALESMAAGLAAFGFRPRLLPLVPGGKAAHATGDRARFATMARALAGMLDKAAYAGRPIVSADPALTWMLRRDLPAAGLSTQADVQTPEAFLSCRIAAGRRPVRQVAPGPGQIFLHCTEQALDPAARGHWTRIAGACGWPLGIAESGCCGMSGLFGHEARHQAWSRGLFDLSWRDRIEAVALHATGFSCRCQVKRLSDRIASHPFAALANHRAD